MNPIYQFQDAISQSGLIPPTDIIADGRIHRFSSNGKPANKNGWYIFHADEPSVGIYGDWSKDFQSKWSVDIGRPYTAEETKAYRLKMELAKSLAEKAQIERQLQAQEEVSQLWANAEAVTFHPYLDKKWIKAHNIKQFGEELLIPMYENKELQSLQHIQADGFKKFHAGGKTKGTYFTIGGKPLDEGILCLCEG